MEFSGGRPCWPGCLDSRGRAPPPPQNSAKTQLLSSLFMVGLPCVSFLAASVVSSWLSFSFLLRLGSHTQPQTHKHDNHKHSHKRNYKHTITNTQPQTLSQTHNITNTTTNTSAKTQPQTHNHKHSHNHNHNTQAQRYIHSTQPRHTTTTHNHSTQLQYTTRGPTSKIENRKSHDHGTCSSPWHEDNRLKSHGGDHSKQNNVDAVFPIWDAIYFLFILITPSGS